MLLTLTEVQRDMMFLPHPPLLGELPPMSGGQRRLIHLNLKEALLVTSLV